MERLDECVIVELAVPARPGDDPSDDLIAFLLDEGVTGVVNALSGDTTRAVFAVVLADETGAPARWAPDGGTVGFSRGDLAGFTRKLRERFGDEAWVVDPYDWPDAAADAATESEAPAAEPLGEFGLGEAWGITGFAWYTEADDLNGPEFIARRVGEPVSWMRLGRGMLYLADDGASAQRLISSGAWSVAASTVMWSTGARRAAALSSKRDAYVHWWDEQWRVVDPSDGWQVDHDGLTVAQIAQRMVEKDPAFAEVVRIAGLDSEGAGDDAQRLRVLLRHSRSDDDTLVRLGEVLGLPPEVALIAEGSLTAEDLGEVSVAEPAGFWRALKVAFLREFRTSSSAGPSGEGAPASGVLAELPRGLRWLEWWLRLTAYRPVWYRIIVVVMVTGSLALAYARLASGAPSQAAIIPLVSAAVWTADYFMPRRRFRKEDD